MKNLTVTEKTRVKRLPKRASYEKGVIYKILDEAFICHIAFKYNDQTAIIPTAFGRKETKIYIHGSNKSRMLKSFKKEDVAISVTHVDGLVLARSAFHPSVNYRSVIIFAEPEKIENSREKIDALKIIMDHIIPGRWEEVRKPSTKELNTTTVFSFKIDEASAKIRSGYPIDEEDDLKLDVWAGILPFQTITKDPVRDSLLKENILIPKYVENYY